ncbi:MAG: hypothetical protein U0P45_09950 [Acidimicrobiales bacterium]
MTDGATSIVADARARVAALLEALGVPAEQDASGDFTIPHHVTLVHLMVSEVDGRAVLDIWAPILVGAPLTPALARFAAETSFMFGRLCLADTGDGLAELQISHTMLADPLDEEILVQQLGAVANTAAEIAEAEQATFGGHRSL